MKNLILTIFLLPFFYTNFSYAKGFRSPSYSSSHVRGYLKRNGSYVQSHQRTTKDHSKINNWSTKGNVNPYTAKRGTKNLWK